MIKIESRKVFSTEGKLVHRLGTDTYFRKGTTLLNDMEADFEEVDAVPPYTKAEYNAKVEELIARRYTVGQEIQFAREKSEAGAKYSAYLEYVAQCKAEAVELLTNRPSDNPENG